MAEIFFTLSMCYYSQYAASSSLLSRRSFLPATDTVLFLAPQLRFHFSRYGQNLLLKANEWPTIYLLVAQ
jgi:hypothetical protein